MGNPMFMIFLLSLVAVCQTRRVAIVKNNCDFTFGVPHTGPGCGIPEYIDPAVFGNNNNSRGTLRITPRRSGLTLSFTIVDLPRPDLVLTAWILWSDPTNPNKPKVFKVRFVVLFYTISVV